jgi:hypothetical protein
MEVTDLRKLNMSVLTVTPLEGWANLTLSSLVKSAASSQQTLVGSDNEVAVQFMEAVDAAHKSIAFTSTPAADLCHLVEVSELIKQYVSGAGDSYLVAAREKLSCG